MSPIEMVPAELPESTPRSALDVIRQSRGGDGVTVASRQRTSVHGVPSGTAGVYSGHALTAAMESDASKMVCMSPQTSVPGLMHEWSSYDVASASMPACLITMCICLPMFLVFACSQQCNCARLSKCYAGSFNRDSNAKSRIRC